MQKIAVLSKIKNNINIEGNYKTQNKSILKLS
jgi:hypothetical protein